MNVTAKGNNSKYLIIFQGNVSTFRGNANSQSDGINGFGFVWDPIVFQLSKLKIIEQIIEEWIYCYPSRTLSQEKIEILKEQHYQNLKDDMRGVVSGIVSAPAWICREIDLEEGANWFLVIATCLDLIRSNKEGKIITKYTDHFHNNLG